MTCRSPLNNLMGSAPMNPPISSGRFCVLTHAKEYRRRLDRNKGPNGPRPGESQPARPQCTLSLRAGYCEAKPVRSSWG